MSQKIKCYTIKLTYNQNNVIDQMYEQNRNLENQILEFHVH